MFDIVLHSDSIMIKICFGQEWLYLDLFDRTLLESWEKKGAPHHRAAPTGKNKKIDGHGAKKHSEF